MAAGSNANRIISSLDERRVWIGNLDPRLSEYHLLKILQKCGPIDKFDMLFHKGGPLVGQSRGYAFATFATNEAALNALEKLNGTYIANRPIAVRLAKNINYDEMEKQKPRIEIPALGCQREGKYSREDAIRAIEAKLKALERNSGTEMEFNSNGYDGPQVPFIQKYQFNIERGATSSGDTNSTNQRTSNRSYTKTASRPYNRNQRPNRR